MKQVNDIYNAYLIASVLLGLKDDEEATLDTVVASLFPFSEELSEQENEIATKTIATFLDSLGVEEDVINDCFSDKEQYSNKAFQSVVKTFNSNFNEDDLDSIVMHYVNTLQNQDVILDNIVPRKQGYKRVLVVRNGKKTWVNKRIQGKRIHLSPAQKRALAKARLKAHTALAKAHRAKSMQQRKTFRL